MEPKIPHSLTNLPLKPNFTDYNTFIRKHLDRNAAEIALMKAPHPDWDMRELSLHLHAYQQMQQKLPQWFAVDGLHVADRLSIEQASSEATAIFKQTFVAALNCTKGVDLCGGLGVDSWALSKMMTQWFTIETDEDKVEALENNFKLLNRPMVKVLHQRAEDFVRAHAWKTNELVFVDPDRRPDGQKRVFQFTESVPDLMQIWAHLKDKKVHLLIKSTPMLDISEVSNQLPVQQVMALSYKNELKELLWYIPPTEEERQRPLQMKAVELFYDWEDFEVSQTTIKPELFYVDSVEELQYIALPSVGMAKLALADYYADQHSLRKISKNTHIYSSEKNPDPSAPFRWFKVKSTVKIQAKALKQLGIKKANVICRNFPLKPEDALKKLKLQQGGKEFLLLFEDRFTKKQALLCEYLVPQQLKA